MRVELIYDTGCPNVAATRANLLQTFAAAQFEARWTEWERSSPASPAYVPRFGSPSVLVDGLDVEGETPTESVSRCRLYASAEGRYSGTPSVELIEASLRRADLKGASANGWLMEADPLSRLPASLWAFSFSGLPCVLATLRRRTFHVGMQLPALIGLPVASHLGIPVLLSCCSPLSSEIAPRIRSVRSWADCRDPHSMGEVLAGVDRRRLCGRGTPDQFLDME